MAEYVYGIVAAGSRPPQVAGIGGASVGVVGDGDGAAALVSEVAPDALRFGREEMLTHARVLETAVNEGGTVLPMRFGVVMEPDEVRDRLLDAHSGELRAQLEELAGKVEMSVRVVYEEEPLWRAVVGADRQIAALRERIRGRSEDATYYERIELGERVADALSRRREADAADLLPELESVSLARQVSSPAHERVVLNASFLVDRDHVAEFDQALERLARERHGQMRFRCVGPLPPHSFVELAQAV